MKSTIKPGTARNASAGFTLIELVVVMVILGILAAVAVPVFFDVQTYKDRAAYDEVASALRYAQKLAVASGCEVRVEILNDKYEIQICDIGVDGQCPDTCTFTTLTNNSGHPVDHGPEENVNLNSTPTSFIFEAMGRSTEQAIIRVGVSQEEIEVHAETGYVDVDVP